MREREDACAGKVAHRSRAIAVEAAKYGRRSHAVALHVYRCPFCGRWHVGQPSVRNKRKRAPEGALED